MEATQANKFIVGLFDHEEKLMKAVKNIRAAGVEPTDAITPFPVHGLEHALGYKDNRLHTAGFVFGATGLLVGLSLMTWIMAFNYPMNIGGKPYWPMPSFVPITFELTVLFSAVGMFFVYIIRNGLFPGKIPRIFHPRLTDDLFALTFAIDDKDESYVNQVNQLLSDNDVMEVQTKEFSENDEIFE